jgi:ABC-type Co2+ transport system permease subunit
MLLFFKVIVMPLEQDVAINGTSADLQPAKMACVSRGLFAPHWKQMIVEFISIATTFVIPVAFIVGCLAALMVNYFRRLRKPDGNVFSDGVA